MARTKKQIRKKGGHSEDAMKKAIKLVEEGISIRQAAKQCQLSYPTVRNYCKRKIENPGQTIRLTPNYENKKVFTKEQELELVKYIERCAELFNNFSSKDCRHIAYQMAKVNGTKMPNSWADVEMAGQEWLRSFRQRHPFISLRKPGASNSKAKGDVFSKNQIDSFFLSLKTSLQTQSGNSAFSEDSEVFKPEETCTTTVHKFQRIVESTSFFSQNQEPEEITPSVESSETPLPNIIITLTNSEASHEKQLKETDADSTSKMNDSIKPRKSTRKRRNLESPAPRKKGNNSRENIKTGILLVRNGFSLRRAAGTVGVPYATLKRYCDKTKNTSLEEQRLQPNYAANKVFNEDLEAALKDYINYCSEIFNGLNSKEFRQVAYLFAKSNNLKIPPAWKRNEMAGEGWLMAFRERHSFTIRKPEPSRATEFNAAKLYEDWQSHVKNNTAFVVEEERTTTSAEELQEDSDEYSDEGVMKVTYSDEDEQEVKDDYQLDVEQDEADYDVCKVETVEHTFTDEYKSQFVPASKDNMPEVNMFAVVEYITNNVKEFKQLDFPTLKSLTKNNPHLISSPLVLQCASSYRFRATISLDRGTSHMCEVEYDTDTDTVANSECLCGADVCQHTAAFLMWLHTRPLTTSTLTSTDTLAGESAGSMLRRSQASDSEMETKPLANVGPSTSRGGTKRDQPPAKRPRVVPEAEVPVPVAPVVPDTAITVIPLPKNEDEPDKSKIECIFLRKTIYTIWKNTTGTTSERTRKIQTALRSKLQDDGFVIDFMPIEQRVQELCQLFESMKNELHKPEYSEFMNIREALELVRVSIGKGGSLRDPLS